MLREKNLVRVSALVRLHSVDKIIENRRNVDKMFDLIHTYILVLLKKIKNYIFVNNYVGVRFYRLIIDSGPSCCDLKIYGKVV